MKFSIITPTYNSAATLGDTLRSIASQTYRDIEHVIVDGASQDDTLNIIDEYSHQYGLNISLSSEPDKGVYDAMNKGLRRASGEIIGIINSDDFLADEAVIADVAACFREDPTLDACYGDLRYVDRQDTGKIVRFWKAGKYRESKLKNGWAIPHPSFFVRRQVYRQYGGFNPDFQIAGDYELILRLLKVHGIKVAYLPRTLACMRAGGLSSRNLSQRRQGWHELRLAWKTNGLRVPSFFLLRRVLGKLGQYI